MLKGWQSRKTEQINLPKFIIDKLPGANTWGIFIAIERRIYGFRWSLQKYRLIFGIFPDV